MSIYNTSIRVKDTKTQLRQDIFLIFDVLYIICVVTRPAPSFEIPFFRQVPVNYMSYCRLVACIRGGGGQMVNRVKWDGFETEILS